MTKLNNLNNELIIKYLRDSLSENEKLEVISWLEVNEQNREFLFGLKEAYFLSNWENIKKSSDVDNEWNKIHSKIIENDKSEKKSKTKIVNQIAKYAAIIVIAFSLGTLFNYFYTTKNPQITTFSTGYGRSSTVILNDGSKVTLNAKSLLIYDQNEDEREVTLKGEAVFDIRKDHKKPFYVNTDYYQIKVLGTFFNVSSYENDDYVATTLKKGSIQIYDINSHKILSELKMGERFYYEKRTGNYFIKTQTDLNDDFGWYDGKLCFNEISLKDLSNKLEREFGYSIVIKNHSVQNYRYKANIEKESLENILNYVSMVTPDVHYKINNESKTILLY